MLIDNSKKIVIKLGSTTVIDKKGNFKKAWVNSLIKDIKRYKKDRDIVIVSSGAIALGLAAKYGYDKLIKAKFSRRERINQLKVNSNHPQFFLLRILSGPLCQLLFRFLNVYTHQMVMLQLYQLH